MVDVLRADKRAFNELLKTHGSLDVRSTIVLDDRDVLYEQRLVDSYRDFDKLQGDIGDAMKSIQKFMADPKKTQLKL